MNIYNSLGSNYNLHYVLQSLLLKESGGKNRLHSFLEKKYGGNTLLFYKARTAITQALILSNPPKDSHVAITGFTCIAVVDAVQQAGFHPVFLDIDYETLNFTPTELERKIKEDKNIKSVIIQNTLGYPCDIEQIQKICKKNKLVLIEDLAHSIGTTYSNGVEAGTVGDFTVLSFSQDKVIDGVSGGALIVKNPKYQVSKQKLVDRSSQLSFQDKYYPLLTFLIRKTYRFGIGKVMHFVCRNLFLLSNPMRVKSQAALTDWHATLALEELRMLEKNITHRKTIAGIYAKNIHPKLLSKKIAGIVKNSTNLRFPVFIENRNSLIDIFEKNGVYLSDIWYDAPVAPKKYLGISVYPKSSCPNAEKISDTILNLPTHKNVSEKDAFEICQIINTWAK